MATSAGTRKSANRKPAKPTRADKAAARSEKRAKRRETWSTVRQAFTLTRQNDPKFLPYLIALVAITLVVAYLVIFLIFSSPYLPIPFAILLALVAGMLFFSRRVHRSAFSQMDGQPGAAGHILQQQLRGDWRLTQAVAGTTQFDAVHRLVGRPGVVLVGEGAQHRVRGLLAQEKKRTARVVGEVPIYDIVVGSGDGDVQLAKLNRYLLKLPSNISKEQVGTLEKRLAALGGSRATGLPKGPMPAGAKMRNVQRTVRRRS